MNTNYDLDSVIGMGAIGSWCTIFGIYILQRTLLKGEVMRPTRGWYVQRYKISTSTPVTFGYVEAFIYTIIFGPGQILLGIIALVTLINVLYF